MSMPWLVEGFTRHLSNALEMMAGQKPSFEPRPEAAPPPESLVWEQTFNVEGARIWLAGVEDSWIAPGTLLLKAAGIDDADAPMAKGTFQETLAQAFSGIASDLTARLKVEVTAGPGSETNLLPSVPAWTALELILEGTPPVQLFFAVSPQLQALVTPPIVAPQQPDREVAVRAAPPGIEHSRTLELLLDVELPVSVSFGRAQLPLKDVIKLTTGSIVELNRTVGEPVEVLVNNCVIARGEVVVIEGNFGVRVQQVISRQERLRTLY